MKQVNTIDLVGQALDWAVAKCEGKEVALLDGEIIWRDEVAYSTDWAQGGPIIERDGLSVAKVGRSLDDAIAPHPACWCSHIDGASVAYGETPLIAAMRCYVASKLGNTVDIPEGL
jgi:hypothetical protein